MVKQVRRLLRVAGLVLVTIGIGAIAGCAAHQAPIAIPITVELPIATPVYCSPPPLDKPVLAIAALTASSTPADTVRAYAATVAILKGAVTERDDVIAGCGKPASISAAQKIDTK